MMETGTIIAKILSMFLLDHELLANTNTIPLLLLLP